MMKNISVNLHAKNDTYIYNPSHNDEISGPKNGFREENVHSVSADVMMFFGSFILRRLCRRLTYADHVSNFWHGAHLF